MTMLVSLGGGGPPPCPHSCALGTDLVSKAFSGLLRGCCSKQLTAGLPATGTVIALSTREVMACTARTWICVLSVSSCKDSPASARHEQPDASKHCVPLPARQHTDSEAVVLSASVTSLPSQGLLRLPTLATTHPQVPETNLRGKRPPFKATSPRAQTSKRNHFLKQLPVSFLIWHLLASTRGCKDSEDGFDIHLIFEPVPP